MDSSEIILAIIVYFLFCNWIQIYYLAKNFLKPKPKVIPLLDDKLLTKYKSLTKLDLSINIIEENSLMVGFMLSSPPFKPIMVFSQKLFKNFTLKELDWVVLHEAGHYLMLHNWKLALSQFILLIIGLFIVESFRFQTLFSILVISLLLPLIYIQVAKIFEYQADNYAVKTMPDPRGMISGNTKMRKVNNWERKRPFIKKFLVIAVPFEERIKMAKREIASRKID